MVDLSAYSSLDSAEYSYSLSADDDVLVGDFLLERINIFGIENPLNVIDFFFGRGAGELKDLTGAMAEAVSSSLSLLDFVVRPLKVLRTHIISRAQ